MKTKTKTRRSGAALVQRLSSSGVPLAARLSLLALATLCITGCSAYRAASKPFIGYSRFAPVIIIGSLSTNLAALASSPAPRSDSVDATADIRAPVIICAEQLYLSFSGGSAASNSVLSQIEIPLVGAP